MNPIGVEVYPIDQGFTNSYIIHSEGTIMVDVPFRVRDFYKANERIPFELDEIELIIITHGHFDHIASLKELKEYTGAKVAVHQNDIRGLKGSSIPVPTGVTLWGSVSRVLLNVFLTPFLSASPVEADIILGEERLSLSDYGVSGRVFHTPGHTEGSSSVLLESGEVFVGDLAMNMFPLSFSPRLSIYSHDFQKLVDSWRSLLSNGAEMIYPGHGEPFSVDIIRESIHKLEIT
jgi:glyoxylase-like metal-dependent hydrolase (beta-lactamase superfamily II)